MKHSCVGMRRAHGGLLAKDHCRQHDAGGDKDAGMCAPWSAAGVVLAHAHRWGVCVKSSTGGWSDTARIILDARTVDEFEPTTVHDASHNVTTEAKDGCWGHCDVLHDQEIGVGSRHRDHGVSSPGAGRVASALCISGEHPAVVEYGGACRVDFI